MRFFVVETILTGGRIQDEEKDLATTLVVSRK
jgi:hypothetical protein